MIFVHFLDDSGYDSNFSFSNLNLTNDILVMAKGKKKSKLYWTKDLTAKDSVNVIYIYIYIYIYGGIFVTSKTWTYK